MIIMEDSDLKPIPSCADVLEIARSKRDAPPTHFTLKIKSFSLLSEIVKKTGVDKYESGDFEAGDYMWKLLLYPNGNAKRNADGHLSLYLAFSNSNAISYGWQVEVTVKFFVYDHIQDKYLTIQDGKVKRYHVLKTEHGFDQLLPLSTFNDPHNGYLVDDCCAFGAEVHFIERTGKGEQLCILKEPQNGSYTWKIERFSTLQQQYRVSQGFNAAEYKWSLTLYPKGDSTEKDRSLSLFLTLEDKSALLGQGVYIDYNLLVKDQVHGNHHERKGSAWMRNTSNSSGFSSLMLLTDLRNASKGFLVNDTLVVTAKIHLISVVQGLSQK